MSTASKDYNYVWQSISNKLKIETILKKLKPIDGMERCKRFLKNSLPLFYVWPIVQSEMNPFPDESFLATFFVTISSKWFFQPPLTPQL